MQVGGVPAVLKYLLQKGFLQGDCLTVTGTALRNYFLGGGWGGGVRAGGGGGGGAVELALAIGHCLMLTTA